MCYNPIRIYNPARKFNKNGGQPFYMEVPCGNCPECKRQMQNDWYFRTYWHAQEILDSKAGFIYFDTLTYDNKNLPKISEQIKEIKNRPLHDFSCFKPEDIRYFFVRLRRQLDYYKYNPKENLTYFITSEYGTDPTKTNRPHYHILLFWKGETYLEPLELSRMVNKCWGKGRTDGIDYHPTKYVMEHVYSAANSDLNHLRKVCNYVSKYVAKDTSFQKEINRRIETTFKIKFEEDLKAKGYDILIKDEQYYKDWKKITRNKQWKRQTKRNICQFHRQSQGFGLYALYNIDYKYWQKNNFVVLPEDNAANPKRKFALPNYYIRKLFYEKITDQETGKDRWKLTEQGKIFKAELRLKNIEHLEQTMKDWYNNINTLIPNDENYTEKELNSFREQTKKLADQYLDGRTWKDYAIYQIIYSGRVKNFMGESPIDNPTIFTLKSLTDIDEMDSTFNPLGNLYGYCHYTWTEKGYNFKKGITTIDIYDEKLDYPNTTKLYEWDEENIQEIILGKYKTARKFFLENCINQNTIPEFRYFDKLNRLYHDSLKGINRAKCNDYDQKIEIRNKHKAIFGTKI